MSSILNSVLVFVVFGFVTNSSDIKNDPYSFLEPCENNRTTIDNCLLYLSNNFIREVNTNGIPSLNLSKAEPVFIKPFTHSIDFSLVKYNIHFKDIVAVGASNLTVQRIRSNLNRLRIEADFYIPRLEVNSSFTSDWDLFGTPVHGGGQFYGTFENVNSYIKFKAKEVHRDGEVYLEVNENDFKLDYNINNAQMRVERLLSGNLVFEAAFNLFLSTNSQRLVDEGKSQIKPAFVSKFFALFSEILKNIPLRKFVEGTKYTV